MDVVAALVYLAILLSAALGVYLQRRQARAALAHRDAPPVEFAASVTLEQHRRSADYTIARMRLSICETLLEAGLAIAWLALLLGPLYALLSRVIAPGLTLSVAVVVAAAFVDHVLHLPLSLAETFGLETRFGFNRATPTTMLLDELKGAALWLLFAVPLLYGLLLALRLSPDYWWIVGFAGALVFLVAMTIVYPSVIAPLFNRFTPLADEELKARMEALLERCGFQSGGLFVMDASTRSTHGNAYFSGLGKAKRIVFFDTLLRKHTPDEIVAILAHELGHFKFGHVRQRLGLAAGVLFIGFLALHLSFSRGLASAFGLPDDPGVVLVVVMTAGAPILHLLSPLTNYLSRRAEFEADDYARAICGREPMVSALTKLSRDNLATLTPDRLYALFYYSHPPAPLRIAALGDEPR
ncbi:MULTISPECIES: M48 family metallopeptidase [Methylosinus]|uniref:Peptidase M48 n=1 Tax=Methylosinus trichosporium (strain ATCC 35070 / NCIMB 11131 / UNIQEM 75 / OB3b) TaxID=595536 RepID=A0A2D2CZ92_METT3|nr:MULTISPECIES: M48 family metallopeptidase [Methylosinus]ATQ68062.1 peptidase M48 [Methylosinus trichosporium OB3b]OBS51511.1 peptidase M48 [Methylosinus sp. 3S-1]